MRSFHSTVVSLVCLDSYPWTAHITISTLYILVEVSFYIRERTSIMLLIPFQLGYNKIGFKNDQNYGKHVHVTLSTGTSLFDKAYMYMWLILEV